MNRISVIFSVFSLVLDKSVSMKNYKDRLMLQKLGYLLKVIDKSIDYKFNWYHRGPYSPDLARDAFNLKNPEYTNTPKIQTLASVIKNLLPDKINEDKLELFSSIIYLINERKLDNLDDILFSIESTKPWFSKEDVKGAFENITKFLQKNS